jgi:chromosome segregation ATPase
MNVSELVKQFEAVVERARAALDRQISEARKVVKDLNAEKAKVQSEIAELQDQHKQSRDQLTAIRADLDKASTLAGLDHEIAGARKTLEKLSGDKAAAENSIAALAKQKVEAERHLVALGNEAQRLLGIRSEAEAVMNNLRSQLRSVSIGVQR